MIWFLLGWNVHTNGSWYLDWPLNLDLQINCWIGLGWNFAKKNPAIPTTIKTMGVNITTIAYLRVLIIEIGVNHCFNGGGSPEYIQFSLFLGSFSWCRWWTKHHVPFSGMFVILRAKLFQPGPVLNLSAVHVNDLSHPWGYHGWPGDIWPSNTTPNVILPRNSCFVRQWQL